MGNLREVHLPDGRTITYEVDARTRRVAKLINGTPVRQWIYRDGLDPVAELDGTGRLLATFAHGPRPGTPELVFRDGATYRILADHLGSPILAVNVSDPSDIPFSARYDAWGNVIAGHGADWMTVGFAGGLYDEDTGLVRFGVRDYDPKVGRWTAKDPLRLESDSLNLYLYAQADPVTFSDPTGQVAIVIPVICAGGGCEAAIAAVGALAIWMCDEAMKERWKCDDGYVRSNGSSAVCIHTCTSNYGRTKEVRRLPFTRRIGPRSTDLGYECSRLLADLQAN